MLYRHYSFLFVQKLTSLPELNRYLIPKNGKFDPSKLDLDWLNNHLQLQYEHLFLSMHLKLLVKLQQGFFLHRFSFQQFSDHLKQDLQLIERQNVLNLMFVSLLLWLMQMIQELISPNFSLQNIVFLILSF